ncbi:MAG: shikimate dehydrogenase, partial [Gammaproteobacteria bacterium]|nr:shikimate dehydrogenase [Gammaproteobacteria bacterium]
MNLLTVIGNPIAHSLSPKIQQLFSQQTGIELHYDKTLTTEQNFSTLLQQLATTHKGCNITAPFKTLAWQLATRLTPEAATAKAVNTLHFTNGEWLGHNTDGIGLVADLTQNLQFELIDKTILLLGAGGAARGVIAALLACKPKQLIIANRNVEKANLVAAEQNTHVPISVQTYARFEHPVDCIINTATVFTPLPTSVLHTNTLCYDLRYHNNTDFLAWATQHDARAFDGLGMLVEQAAAAFEFWFGVKPVTQPVLQQV